MSGSYNHGGSGARAGAGSSQVLAGIEELRRERQGRFGGVACLEGFLGGVERVHIEHVFANGAEDDVDGELCQAALVLGSQDRVCLRLISIPSCTVSGQSLPFLSQ